MKISASVVLYNTSLGQLSRLISCLDQAKVVQSLYIIDNSPMPISHDLFSLPWIIYIRSSKNVGYGSAHNISLKQILEISDFHFILNPDVYFDPIEIQRMLVHIRQDDSIGQLMPKVLYPNGDLQYLCKLLPTPIDLFIRRFLNSFFKGLARKSRERYELRFTDYIYEMNIPTLSGCFMLFRVSALKEVGLFDERFFMYAEDFDITRRIHRKYKTIFFPGATIIHEHAKESYKNKKMLYIHVVSLIKYFNKWGWFFDKERKDINTQALKNLKY